MLQTATKVLIVEDEIVVAMDIQDCLSRIGHVTSGIALTGEDAISKARSLRPDLVLMDIKLGGDVDGIAAAQMIFEQLNIPVVYLTAYSDEQTLDRAKKTGPFGYILKPMEENELRSVIDVALFKYRMENKLKESKKWLQTTLKTINDGVITTDNAGYITFMNPVAESTTGQRYDENHPVHVEEVFTVINETTGQPIRDIVSDYNKIYQACRGTSRFYLISKDGKNIPIDWNVMQIVNTVAEGQVSGFVIVFHDITKFRQAEAILENSRSELERLVTEQTKELRRINEELKEEIAERKQIEKSLKKRELDLEAKSKSLEEMNTALKILIKNIEEDNRELEEKVISNVKGLVLPYLEKLSRSKLDPAQLSYLEMAESHLKDIISPFLKKMASFNLTPKEIQIASLIKENKTTKEIANVVGIAQSSVEFHRHNIRRKLGIINEKTNLQAFLLSLT